MDLKNKVIVICGASRGLGSSLAKNLAQEGVNMVLSSRTEKDLEKLSGQLKANYCLADVTKEQDLQKLANFALEKYGQVDVWINNAGVWSSPTPAEQVPGEKIQEIIAVNLFGTIYGCRAALSQFKKQGYGAVLNILSTSALEGRAGQAAYCAAKFGAMGYAKAVRKELEGTKISVLNVYPGGMQTHFFGDKKPAEYGIYMNPDEVAQKISANLKLDVPEEELILRRPK